jgi:hypothetical protein
MFEIIMNLIIMTRLSNLVAISHNLRPIVTHKLDVMIHFGSTLMFATYTFMHLK